MIKRKLTLKNVHYAYLTELWYVSTSTSGDNPPSPEVQYLWKTDLAFHQGTVGLASDYRGTKEWPGYWETNTEALSAVEAYNTTI